MQARIFRQKEEKLPDENHFPMIHIDGGKFFFQGSIETKISPFWLGQFQLSQKLYEAVIGENPSSFKGHDLPVESVSWYDALVFCNELSRLMGYEEAYEIDRSTKDPNNESKHDQLKWTVSQRQEANGFRLPTEAEWEYAASGAYEMAPSEFSGSKVAGKAAWYGYIGGLGRNETQSLGLKVPNEMGLYDMSGNVREWCWDWYDDLSSGPLKDPKGASKGQFRVLRGGSWRDFESSCRVSSRDDSFPDARDYGYGFRLARTAFGE